MLIAFDRAVHYETTERALEALVNCVVDLSLDLSDTSYPTDAVVILGVSEDRYDLIVCESDDDGAPTFRARTHISFDIIHKVTVLR